MMIDYFLERDAVDKCENFIYRDDFNSGQPSINFL